MKSFVRALALVLALSQNLAVAQPSFPESPDPQLTPGSLCSSGKTRRYPEGILYCSRDVDSSLKREIIAEYDRRLGYRIGDMNRAEFKIDHYIPLCMGGSNEPDNLWPQHESIYRHTDMLEQKSCQKMSEGKLRQADAVKMIQAAKADPSKASAFIQRVERM